MNIQDAILNAGEGGKIRLGKTVLEIPSFKGSLCIDGYEEGYILNVAELVSNDWQFLRSEWTDIKIKK